MVSVVQEMVGRKCVNLSHTYRQVAMHDLKVWNQYLINNFRHWSTHKAKYSTWQDAKVNRLSQTNAS